MAQVSRATFASTLASKINDNTAGDITAQDVREMFTDLEDSALWYDEVETAIEALTLTSVTGATGDEVLIIDATDGGLKTVSWDDLPSGGAGEVTLDGAETLTNKTLTAPVINGTVTGTYTLGGTPTLPSAAVGTAIEGITLTSVSGATGDEVLMIDATDGSLKAVLWENLPGAGGGMTSFSVDGDTGTPEVVGDGNTLTIAGGTGIDTAVSATDTVTVAIDSTVATLTGSQTLTNKTLTAPVLGGTVTGTYTLGGTPTFPASVVQLTSTQTLTNKTLTAPVLGGTITGTYTLGGSPTFPSSVVQLADTQTLTNKTLTAPVLSGTITGTYTLGGTPTFPSTVVTTTGTQTLTNKTITMAGTLNGGGFQVEGFVNKVVTSVSGSLTAAAHSGNIIKTSGNVTVPTTAGFNCIIIAGGAHTVTFNGGTSAAMATGDIMTVVVESSTVIHAVLTPADNKVAFV